MDSDGKVRLPELSIFKKYSLALRQEFSDPEDVLVALRDTYAEVEEATGLVSEPLADTQIREEPGAQDPQQPPQRGTTFRLDAPSEGRPEPRPAKVAPEPLPAPQAKPAPEPRPAAHGPSAIPAAPSRRVFDDDDPRSYLKRLAASRPAEFPDVEEEAGPAGSPAGKKKEPPAPKARPEEAPRTTSPQDEESFWGKASRRPKKEEL